MGVTIEYGHPLTPWVVGVDLPICKTIPLPLQTKEQSWTELCLWGQISFLQVTTNLLYHRSVESLQWMLSKVEEIM